MSRKDYMEFMNTEDSSVPKNIDINVKKFIATNIKVTIGFVFKKLFAIHVISAFITLSICPQFGVRFFSSIEHGIAGIVMQYGTIICGMFCGAVFMGTTAILSIILFKKSELAVLYKNSLWIFSVLATLSLIVLMLIGSIDTLVFTLSWLASGIFLSEGILIITKPTMD